ncbi:mitochondrial ribosomal protein L37-domain-containing protein [Hypoxylon sp. NC1633]|nr:mitochondrial ribosomal protein L37-domain-containing protein [Hypoxylon sp. NC1633]
MICQRCLLRASTLTRSRVPQIRNSPSAAILLRPLSTTITRPSSTPGPEPPSSSPSDAPVFGTPLGDAAAEEKPKLSACPEGTVLTGLNYFKDRTDPVALADEAYPAWLWDCIAESEKTDGEAAADAGDEFSKSKKERRIAAKRQRALEAKLLAEGNLEALAPKIPLHHQSINLPANKEGTMAGALEAERAREILRRAMQRDRKNKIRESNYLKSM